jgi:hypothetical protein
MTITVENKFEMRQTVFMRRADKAVVSGKVTSVFAALTGTRISVSYSMDIVDGKNVRTAGFVESDVFATADEAFLVPRND